MAALPPQRTLLFALIGFGLVQLIWYFSMNSVKDNSPTTFGPSSSAACPIALELLSDPEHFAVCFAARKKVHIVCEIGHDPRLGPAFWLGHPTLAVYRFGDEFVEETIPPVVDHTRRVRYLADPKSLYEWRYLFHCDLIAVTNASSLPEPQLVQIFDTLRQYSKPSVPVLLLGVCPGCSDYGSLQYKAWRALERTRLILPKTCGHNTDVETWCLASLVPHRSLGKFGPAHVPNLDPAMMSIARKRATRMNGTTLLTTVTNGFRDFVLNYECSLRRIGLEAVIYQPMDQESVKLIEDMNSAYEGRGIARKVVAAFDPQMLANLSRIVSWKENDFIEVMKHRFALQAELLLLGFNVFLCDADVSFAMNPMPYFHYDATIEAQPDIGDWSELDKVNHTIQLNGGFYLTLATNDALGWFSFIKEVWLNGSATDPKYDDQDALALSANRFVCFTQYPNMPGYSCPEGRTATFKFLDLVNFPTGHIVSTKWKSDLFKSKATSDRPIVGLHANGPSAWKAAKLQDLGLWFGQESVSDRICNQQWS